MFCIAPTPQRRLTPYLSKQSAEGAVFADANPLRPTGFLGFGKSSSLCNFIQPLSLSGHFPLCAT
jgi:hypothetical protein